MSDEATDTTPEAKATVPRYDIIALSQNRAFNMVEQGLKSLINYLQACGWVRVYDEAIAEEWTEVYAKVGPSSHEMFVKGPYAETEPVFLEVAVHSGVRPFTVPFGPPDPEESCYFWIEIRGALFDEVAGKLKNKLKDVMSTRLDFYTRAHASLPPHAEVGPDEQPIDKKLRKGGPAQRVGTAVEEF